MIKTIDRVVSLQVFIEYLLCLILGDQDRIDPCLQGAENPRG